MHKPEFHQSTLFANLDKAIFRDRKTLFYRNFDRQSLNIQKWILLHNYGIIHQNEKD